MRAPTPAGILSIWALALLVILAPGLARACPVCIDRPERTVADHALEDWIVLLARQDPQDPHRFEPVEMLRGSADDLADAPEIPFLIDSATEREMAREPALSVLLSYGPPEEYVGRTPGSGQWYRHLDVTTERRALLDAILDEGALWEWGMTTDPARFGFFADRIADPDPVTERMALAEISRAPYALIRQIDPPPARTELMQQLTEATDLPMAPIRILLLGLSDAPGAEAATRRGFDAALTRGGPYAAAWIVAGIERDGADALARVTDRLLATPAPSPDMRREILTALTVTGNARPELRPVIAPALLKIMERFPEHAGDLAYSFYAWRDWSAVPLYEAMLKGDLDHQTRYILQIVVVTARAEQDEAALAPH